MNLIGYAHQLYRKSLENGHIPGGWLIGRTTYYQANIMQTEVKVDRVGGHALLGLPLLITHLPEDLPLVVIPLMELQENELLKRLYGVRETK